MKTILEVASKSQWAPARLKSQLSEASRRLLAGILVCTMASPLLAQGNSPWENAVNVLQLAFTGPIARGLALVSIVIGGLMFAFDEGGSKKMMAGIIFGVGMAIGAVNFMAWLFP
ncbi:MAG: TrbC/VirB2 family protein [Acidobacteriia bacterium]|nr:TrbC/VirB2 family protein [Terriglobia bacterium]